MTRTKSEEDGAIWRQKRAARSGSAKAHYNRGKAHLEMGNVDSASEEHRALKELDAELAEELHVLISVYRLRMKLSVN